MSLRGRRIIITGSGGLVGSHLAPRLAAEGAGVIPLDVRQGIDITDWGAVKDYRDIDIIYHLVARTFIPATSANPGETYRVNLAGTLNMLELGRINNVEKFVFASSYVYGPPRYLPVDENHPVNPVNAYNRSKAMGEELCRAYAADYGLKCTIIRAFNIYGRGQAADFLLPTILRQIASGKIELQDAAPRRDMLYVKDAVEAYVKVAGDAGSGGDVFNIGLGKSYSVAEIVAAVLKVTGRQAKVKYLNQRRKDEIMDTVADITRAGEALDWHPQFDLEAGLRDMI